MHVVVDAGAWATADAGAAATAGATATGSRCAGAAATRAGAEAAISGTAGARLILRHFSVLLPFRVVVSVNSSGLTMKAARRSKMKFLLYLRWVDRIRMIVKWKLLHQNVA